MSAYDAFEGGDDLDDLADAMGEDFGFGFDEADDADPNIKPKVPMPEEVVAARTHNSVTLSWSPLGQAVNKLLIQCMPWRGGKLGFTAGFDRTSKGGGKMATINDPDKATTGVVPDLEPTTEYVFRLVAKNPAGFTEGEPCPPISTLAFAPLRGDKSGWLVKVDEKKPKIQEQSGGRKLSIKKKGPERLWFVLDGALLTWFDTVDGKELGYCHLGKLKELSWASSPNNTRFRLDFNDGKSFIEIDCVSEVPTKTSTENFNEWVKELTAVRARVGNAQAFHRSS